MLKQQLNIKLQQRLSPMQIQVIKMLEYPTLELEERIREEIVDNPALEIAAEDDDKENKQQDNDSDSDEVDTIGSEDAEWAWNDDNDDVDSIPEYRLHINNHSADDKEYHKEQSVGQDLNEYLLEQLSTLKLNEDERNLCEYVIGNIDTNGYLRRSVEQLVDDMAMTLGQFVEDDKMAKAIKTVQSLDPAGVAAADLQECLQIQLESALKDNAKSEPLNTAYRIVNKYFDALSKKQYANLMKRLNVSRQTMDEALNIIRHLNPNPGANYGSGSESVSQTIMPDFVVENINNRLTVSLNNNNVPELRISPEFSQMLKDISSGRGNANSGTKEAIAFAKQKIDSAKWFIDSLNQRNNTLLQTMKAIVDFQREYFLTGDDKNLHPMRLKDIADRLGFDISTISRVSNSKYVETEWGIIPLKHFFSESMVTHDGEEISNKEIKSIIKDTVENEDKNNPIADDALTELLNEKGYKIARRTVAKYREQLNIPVARLRKKF